MTTRTRAADLFLRACKSEESGDLRSAFRLMLAAAKLGDAGAQLNVGNYYADNKVVRRNRAAALYWYKRADRRGLGCAAHNLGIFWQNEKNFSRALSWFYRAVKLGEDGSNLEIGKHFLTMRRISKRQFFTFSAS